MLWLPSPPKRLSVLDKEKVVSESLSDSQGFSKILRPYAIEQAGLQLDTAHASIWEEVRLLWQQQQTRLRRSRAGNYFIEY